jgi:hypothetical protein
MVLSDWILSLHCTCVSGKTMRRSPWMLAVHPHVDTQIRLAPRAATAIGLSDENTCYVAPLSLLFRREV